MRQALGDKAGIRRYGHFTLPMEETLVTTAVDLGGRAYLVFQRRVSHDQDRRVRQRTGRRFLASLRGQRPVQPARRCCTTAATATTSAKRSSRATARALRMAVEHDPRITGRAEHQGTACRPSSRPDRRSRRSLVDVRLQEPRQAVEVAVGLDVADDGDQRVGIDQLARTARSSGRAGRRPRPSRRRAASSTSAR